MAITLLTLVGLAVTCAVVLGGRSTRALERLAALPPAAIAVLLGGSFQVTHFVEHGLQLGYWLGHPADPPWLTPWAAGAAGALASASLGVEVLHLVGNAIFLGAVLVLVSITAADPRRRRAAWWCLVVQGAHVVEHVALTASVAVTGRAIGVSTLFGSVAPGPGAWSYRVLLHFAVNLVATVLALRALHGLAPPSRPTVRPCPNRWSTNPTKPVRSSS